MLKPDRFSCSQKIWLKWDPPVLVIIRILHLHALKLHFHIWWYPDQVTMALEVNNVHVLCCTVYIICACMHVYF